MQLLKLSRRTPRLSLVLVDWSVRESFHVLDYLARQSVPRDLFEVIVVEYYSTVSKAAERHADVIDTWVTLDMPPEAYYHKHLMYNAGIVLARGQIVLIGDSDAMVRPSFVASILSAFDSDPDIVFHIDQFRNSRQDLYPFCYPDFEQVIGPGCINRTGDLTAGVSDHSDPIHSRNYGACMCARRDDLIAIGGADMHIDYLGHVCGPYDMTFRLVNMGRREIWSETEFTYHTWHPGQAGEDNYLGPHDGRHMSTTALQALTARRVMPLVENRAIRMIRTGQADAADALEHLVEAQLVGLWGRSALDATRTMPIEGRQWIYSHAGARIWQSGESYEADWLIPGSFPAISGQPCASLDQARAAIERSLPKPMLRTLRRLSRFAALARMVRPGLRAVLRVIAGKKSLVRLISSQPLKRNSMAGHGHRNGLETILSVLIQCGRSGEDLAAVVVCSRIDAWLIRLAGAFGLVPAIPVIASPSGGALPVLVAALVERDGGERRVLLQAEAFWRGYCFLPGKLVDPLVIA